MSASLPPDRPVCGDAEPTIAPAPAPLFDLLPARPVVPAEPVAPVGEGLEALGPRELLPLLKIRQELTPRAPHVPLGSWFLTSDPDSHSMGREIVLLSVTRDRRLDLPDDDAARDALLARIKRKTGVEVPGEWDSVVCAAPDGERPDPHDAFPTLAERCADCPMARWRTDASGRRMQDCAPRFRVLLFDRYADHACLYLARGAAYGPTQDWLAALDVACRRHGLPAFAFGTTIFTKGVQRGDRHFHVPVFSTPYPVGDPKLVVRLLAERHRPAGEAA